MGATITACPLFIDVKELCFGHIQRLICIMLYGLCHQWCLCITDTLSMNRTRVCFIATHYLSCVSTMGRKKHSSQIAGLGLQTLSYRNDLPMQCLFRRSHWCGFFGTLSYRFRCTVQCGNTWVLHSRWQPRYADCLDRRSGTLSFHWYYIRPLNSWQPLRWHTKRPEKVLLSSFE